MISNKLNENGLKVFMTGSEYSLFSKRVGDKVIDEIEEIALKNNINPDNIYSAKQVHGNNIEYCDGTNGDKFLYGCTFEDTDGLITDKKDIVLMTKVSDCTPIVVFDKEKKVQGSFHSGWRGTSKKISKKGIEIMVSKFKCDVENIIAFIGPTIDYKNYEVGCELYDEFSDFNNRNEIFKPHSSDENKYLLDLRLANLSILLESGIKRENIEISEISTYTNRDYHSYRRDKPDYHLNAIFSVIE